MKLITKVDVLVLAKLANPSKDGSKTYHSLTIFDPESQESGSINCSDDVYANIEPAFDSVTTLTCEYNDKYGSFRAVAFE